MHFCFSCISYLPFGTEIVRQTKTQPCYILANNNALDRFLGYIVFAGRGHQNIICRSYDADKNYWRKCQIYQKYIPYKYKLTAVNIIPE